MGAAIQAALKAGDASVDELVVTDVAPFTLGIASVAAVGSRHVTGVFSPILERGTVIPASRVEQFSTVEGGQQEIEVEVYQGEHPRCDDNTFLGRYVVKGIPKGKAGEQSIDVRFTYDLNGVLEVETTIEATGVTQQLVIERNPGVLSPEQVRRARSEMQRLKFHPRDTLPNRTALARADALFAELSGERRRALGAAIASFRAMLETQDPKAIEAEREGLTSLVSMLAG